GVQAVEVDGQLVAQQEHVGYGQYFAIDRSLPFHRAVSLPNGEIMIDDANGTSSLWTVIRDSGFAWVTKNNGAPDIPNGTLAQVIRVYGGRLFIRINER